MLWDKAGIEEQSQGACLWGEKRRTEQHVEPLLGGGAGRAKSLGSLRGLMVEGVPGEAVLACAGLCLSVSEAGTRPVRGL